jgi:hypothetical protein
MVMDRTFYILSSRVNAQYLLAFVNGGSMPSADKVSPLASSLLQVESKARASVLHKDLCSRP